MAMKILELCDVAPPEGSVQPCTIPLTFFDLGWYAFPLSTDRVFLYRAPRCSTATFLSTLLPSLKLSLSHALKLFYPLAGRLVPETATDLPCIRYSDGDFVVLTVAESDDDLKELTSDGPKDNARFRRLVPTLSMSETNQPVVALQVTIFPEQGIAVGITVRHIAMDGSSYGLFMRTWTSICKSQGGEEVEAPFYDRSQILGPFELQGPFFSKIKHARSFFDGPPKVRSQLGVVRATFHLTTVQIEEVRKWVAGRTSDASGSRFSSFTLAVALVWTCLLKARGCEPKKIEGLRIPVDCRTRLGISLPSSYFGNVAVGCLVELDGSVLVGGEGLAAAAVAIREALREFPVGYVALRSTYESRVEEIQRITAMEMLSLAGSPRMRVYELDFGWGRPAKVEIVSIDSIGAMSLSEFNREGVEDGLEIGLTLPLGTMEEFTKLFNSTLMNCS